MCYYIIVWINANADRTVTTTFCNRCDLWENINGIEIKNSSVLHECILFGFPNFNPEEKEKLHVLNYCILYTKYYIYIQRLFQNNSLDIYAYQMQIKAALEIEFKICKKTN